MLEKRKLSILMATLLLIAGYGANAALASETTNYPTRDIRMIVNMNPGGGYDIIARTMAPFLQKHLPSKVNIIVQNMGGSKGREALNALVKARPDGYTIAFMDLVSYAPDRVIGTLDVDLKKISWLAKVDSQVWGIAASPSSPYKTLQDMQQAQKLKAAVTSALICASAIAAKELKLNFDPILYPGSKDAILAAIRGDVDYVQFSTASLKNLSKVGDKELRQIVTLGSTRSTEFPDVPSIAEMGYTELGKQMTYSKVIAAPPALPEDVKKILNDAIAKTLKDPELVSRLEKQGYLLQYGGPKEVASQLDNTLALFDKYKDIIKQYISN